MRRFAVHLPLQIWLFTTCVYGKYMGICANFFWWKFLFNPVNTASIVISADLKHEFFFYKN